MNVCCNAACHSLFKSSCLCGLLFLKEMMVMVMMMMMTTMNLLLKRIKMMKMVQIVLVGMIVHVHVLQTCVNENCKLIASQLQTDGKVHFYFITASSTASRWHGWRRGACSFVRLASVATLGPCSTSGCLWYHCISLCKRLDPKQRLKLQHVKKIV